jgi:hypothetical protein
MDEREMFLDWWCAEVPEYLRESWKHSVSEVLDTKDASEKLACAWDTWQAARRTMPDREAWISASERIPLPGTSEVLAWNSEGWCAVINPEYVSPAFPEYTHWMPLPAAPTSDKGGA